MAVYAVAALTYKRTGGTDLFVPGLRAATLDVSSATARGGAVDAGGVPWAQAMAGPLSWTVTLSVQHGTGMLQDLKATMLGGETLDVEMVLGEARRVSGSALVTSIGQGGSAGSALAGEVTLTGKNKLYGWYEATYPDAPANLAVVSNTAAGITFSWDAVADVDGYYLYWGTRQGGGYSRWVKIPVADLANAAAPEYLLERFNFRTVRLYYFVVTSYNDAP